MSFEEVVLKVGNKTICFKKTVPAPTGRIDAFEDGIDQDQSAQNVQSDRTSRLFDKEKFSPKINPETAIDLHVFPFIQST